MPPPDINGLRPAYGPESGGDNIKVLGSDLGTSREDIVDVRIVGCSCGAKNITWVSPNKLEVTLPPGRGKGAVSVTTRSGGEGTSSVQFTYEAASDGEEEDNGIDPLEEHDEWSEQFDFSPDPKSTFSTNSTDADPLQLNARGRKNYQPTGAPVPAVVEAYGPYGFSSSLADEAFKPACCLTDTYIDASVKELRDGLENLQKRSQKKGNSQKVLLKNHVTTFIACFDAVSSVDGMIKKCGGGTGITADLEQLIVKITHLASELYQPMLDKRRECERDRNALDVLNTYKYLFSLPKDLMLKSQEEDWPAVIAGYERAKTAKTQTSITVFAEILEVIESIIETVREKLFSMLAEPGRTHDELDRIIKHLHELGSEKDPAWFCLVAQKKHVEARLDECVDSLSTSVEAADEMSVSMQVARWDVIKARVKSARMMSGTSVSSLDSIRPPMSMSRAPSETPSIAESGYEASLARTSTGSTAVSAGTQFNGGRREKERKAHPAVPFLEDLSRVMNEHLPSLWKLGISSLQRMSGLKDDSDLTTLENIDMMIQDIEDEETANALMDRKDELEGLMRDMVESYADKVREHVMDEQTQIRKCFGLQSALGLSSVCITDLVDLSADFQRHTVEKVFEEAATEIRGLQSAEDWQPSPDGLHTSLPDRFGSIVCRAIGSLSELCSAPTCPSKFIFESDEEGEELMCSCLSAFETILERLASAADTSQGLDALPRSRNKRSESHRRAVAPAEKRWMLVMSNCLYTRSKIIPMIAKSFGNLRLGNLDLAFDDEIKALEDLDFRCFELLLNQRAILLHTLLLQCVSELPENGGKPPLQVRNYAKQILLQLIQVHADVAAFARPFVKRVISQLHIRVAKNFHTILSSYEMLGHDPAAEIEQLQLEVAVFKKVLVKFDREESVWLEVEQMLSARTPPKRAKKVPKAPQPTTVKPELAPAPARTKSKAAAAGASPTPARTSSRKGGRALPKPGRALPKPGGRKSLPKVPGRKQPPIPNSTSPAAPASPAPPSPPEPRAELPSSENDSVANAAGPGTTTLEESVEVDIEASVEDFLKRTRFQHACFQVDPEDFDVDQVHYDDSEVQTVLEVQDVDDDDDFV